MSDVFLGLMFLLAPALLAGVVAYSLGSSLARFGRVSSIFVCLGLALVSTAVWWILFSLIFDPGSFSPQVFWDEKAGAGFLFPPLICLTALPGFAIAVFVVDRIRKRVRVLNSPVLQ